jgi:SAM-dependent methyltransferase
MDRLTDAEELLDGPLEDLPALAGNLRDLRRANRLLGGVALSRRAIEILVPAVGARSRTMTLIDVGTGAADIPVALMADARRHGRTLTITAVDSRPEVIEAARQARPALDRIGGLRLAVADGLALPYPNGAFDVAHSSMVLHHLEPPEGVVFLRELGRVARIGVVLNDLDRSRLGLIGAWLLSHCCTRNELTRVDAPRSVRRAYTPDEAVDLLAEAGLRPRAILRGGPAQHRWAIVAVEA